MKETENNEFATPCYPSPSPQRVPEVLAECAMPERQKEKQEMPYKTKRLRDHVILGAFAVMVAARLSFGGAGLPNGLENVPKPPVSTLWRVTYRGGPNVRRQDLEVNLRVSENLISYAAADGQPGSKFSIPVADVTDVSDAVIEGNRDEKVFAPDDLNPYGLVGPCEKAKGLEDACMEGGIAGLIPFWILKSVLVNIPYKDRFIRIAWQREGKDAAAVFQVRSKDFAALREELERVTEKSVGNGVTEQASHEAVHAAPSPPTDVLGPTMAHILVQQRLMDQCQSGSFAMPAWLRPSPNLKALSLCPSTTAEINEARNQLFAK